MKRRYKYNLRVYYQATIIYFIAFVLYVVIRDEFVENSFHLILKDPILYAFATVVIISLIYLLYNTYKEKYIEISENEITLGNKYSVKKINLDEVEEIKIFKKKLEKTYSFLRVVRIKIKSKRRNIFIRTSDYENEEELVTKFKEIKNQIERKNV